jgi:Coenzyme PQQ synthesis protein D (PqqD)
MAYPSVPRVAGDEPARATLQLRSRDLGWRSIDDEVIAIDLVDSRYLATNAAGAKLWALLAEGTDIDALVEALVSGFGLPVTRARDDVAAFLRSLEERSLLEALPADA